MSNIYLYSFIIKFNNKKNIKLFLMITIINKIILFYFI